MFSLPHPKVKGREQDTRTLVVLGDTTSIGTQGRQGEKRPHGGGTWIYRSRGRGVSDGTNRDMTQLSEDFKYRWNTYTGTSLYPTNVYV